MNNRVYGIIGIGSYMANWNADFTNHPKTLGDGTIFGSDKALKYSIRYHMVKNGGKVLFFKSYKDDNGKLQPNDLDEKYELTFGKKIEKGGNANEVLTNLLSANDVMNFGATYAGKQNISILGIVQIGQGFNKYLDTEIHTQDILSPFRNSQKADADQNTLGTHTITDEAHYIYPFSVNPSAIEMYKDIVPNIKYTENDYNWFKSGALDGATLLNTANKMGCENEFAVFINLNDGSKIYLPSLDSYISLAKINNKIQYDLNLLTEQLMKIEKEISKVELYYNPIKVSLIGNADYNYEIRDIITKQLI